MPNIGINDFLPANEGASGTVNPEPKHFVLHQTLVNHSSEYLSSDAGFREISKLVKSDPAVLMRQDRHGNLPIHYLCCRCTDKRAFQLFHDVNSTCFSIKNKQLQLPIHQICSLFPREREYAQLILSAYPQGAETTDAWGNLPIHLVAGTTGNEQLLAELHTLYPDGFMQMNKHGVFPLAHTYRSEGMFCKMVELCPSSLMGPRDQSSPPFQPLLGYVVNRMEMQTNPAKVLRKGFADVIEEFVSRKQALVVADVIGEFVSNKQAQNEPKSQVDHQLTDESSRRKEKDATMDRRKKASTGKDTNKKLESQLGFLRKQNTGLQRKVKLFKKDVKEKEMQIKQMSDQKNTSELDDLRKKNKELEDVIEANQRGKERDHKTLQGAPDENKRVRDEYEAYRKKSRDQFAHRAETFQVIEKMQREVIEAGRKLDKVLIDMLDGHSADDNPPLLPIKAMKAFAESLHQRTQLLEAQSDSQKPKQRSKIDLMFDMFMASPNLSRSSLAEFIHCSHQLLEETLEKNGRTLSTSTANNEDDFMSTKVSDDTTEARLSKRARVSLETSDS